MGYTFMLSVFFWPKQVTWQSLWVFVSQEVIGLRKHKRGKHLFWIMPRGHGLLAPLFGQSVMAGASDAEEVHSHSS